MFDIKILDASVQQQKNITAVYLLRHSDQCLLIDCGPESKFKQLLNQLAKFKLGIKDITAVLLSHIHLDHAGAAGKFAAAGAKVFVHPLGVRHLINPGKLLASAGCIFWRPAKKNYGVSYNRLIQIK